MPETDAKAKKARSPNETVPRQFRLKEETLALLDAITESYQLKSRSDAIRLAARTLADSLRPAAPVGPVPTKVPSGAGARGRPPGGRTTPKNSPDSPVRGPYLPPDCRIGQLVTDVFHGDVRVAGFTPGPVRWPVRRNRLGREFPVLCGDFVAALAAETAAAVAAIFGIDSRDVPRLRRLGAAAAGLPPFTSKKIARD